MSRSPEQCRTRSFQIVMCGIAGEITFAPTPLPETWVKQACDLMAHRGPDGEGIFLGQGVAFGHRRLAIIDLAEGAQPMRDVTGRYLITFNGEIYNYRELRHLLETKGCAFRTHSDTEVILNSYACWGTACVERFNGIFAFGLWDEKERTLFLARDHLGVKPLLYFLDDAGMAFASELKALLKHPRATRELDAYALSDYLSLGYILTPKTMIRNIRKLPPATRGLLKNGVFRLERYWDLAEILKRPARPIPPEHEAIDGLRTELGRAVAQQLVSDVPVGSFLSGGIDSSAITQNMVAAYPEQVKTFSIGFEEKSYSELPYARLAANFLQTRHFDDIIAPDLPALLPRLVWYFDEPFADTSSVPTYFLCRLARQHVKVALSGDGGDECFAGYDTYLADKAQAIYNAWIPDALHRVVIAPLMRHLPATHRKVSWDYKLKQFVQHARLTPEQGHYSWRLLFSEAEKDALWDGEARRQIGDYTPFDAFAAHYADVPHVSPLHRALYVDAKTWLADAMLVKVDRASMANGLEVRVPFLDRQLVEFAMSLPERMKLNGICAKYLLKKAMRGYLPKTIIFRAKRGFNSPVAYWVDAFDKMMTETACDVFPRLSQQWKNLSTEHHAHRADHGFRMWALINWVAWQQAVLRA